MFFVWNLKRKYWEHVEFGEGKSHLPFLAVYHILSETKHPEGGHSLKICDGYIGHIDPLFQTACHWMTPLFLFHILLSPNDPHFQNALSLNDPLF